MELEIAEKSEVLQTVSVEICEYFIKTEKLTANLDKINDELNRTRMKCTLKSKETSDICEEIEIERKTFQFETKNLMFQLDELKTKLFEFEDNHRLNQITENSAKKITSQKKLVHLQLENHFLAKENRRVTCALEIQQRGLHDGVNKNAENLDMNSNRSESEVTNHENKSAEPMQRPTEETQNPEKELCELTDTKPTVSRDKTAISQTKPHQIDPDGIDLSAEIDFGRADSELPKSLEHFACLYCGYECDDYCEECDYKPPETENRERTSETDQEKEQSERNVTMKISEIKATETTPNLEVTDEIEHKPEDLRQTLLPHATGNFQPEQSLQSQENEETYPEDERCQNVENAKTWCESNLNSDNNNERELLPDERRKSSQEIQLQLQDGEPMVNPEDAQKERVEGEANEEVESEEEENEEEHQERGAETYEAEEKEGDKHKNDKESVHEEKETSHKQTETYNLKSGSNFAKIPLPVNYRRTRL
jgi:hypothetical protein